MDKELLFERYPEIAFLLTYELGEESTAETQEGDLVSWYASCGLDKVDLVYLFGMHRGAFYPVFQRWLQEKKERRLIVLSEDLKEIRSALSSYPEMLSDRQVFLQYFVRKQKKAQIEGLTDRFCATKIEVIATPSFLEKNEGFFKKTRLELLRKASVKEALLTEALYAHQLVFNVLSNFKQWEKSFFANDLKGCFKNVPAIICGAGPSLTASIPILKTLEDKALVIAGGSAIAALSNQGVLPHFGIAFDPNPEEYHRLKIASSFEMPLIYGTRVEPHIFHAANGPLGYLHSWTGGPCESYFEKAFNLQKDPIGIDLGKEAFSVTTLGVAFAVALGCSPIILNGVDLAYTGMQRYSSGIVPTSDVLLEDLLKEKRVSEQLLKKKGIQGKMLYTLVKWVMESECISAYAKKHKEAEWVNVSCSGLGFKGIDNMLLEDVVEKYCTTSWDLKGRVHAHIQALKIEDAGFNKITYTLETLNASLKRLGKLSAEIGKTLEEAKQSGTDPSPGKMTLLQLDFEEESGFECFLSHVGPALSQLLSRSFGEAPSVEKQSAKWEHFQEVIRKHQEQIKRVLCQDVEALR